GTDEDGPVQGRGEPYRLGCRVQDILPAGLESAARHTPADGGNPSCGGDARIRPQAGRGNETHVSEDGDRLMPKMTDRELLALVEAEFATAMGASDGEI